MPSFASKAPERDGIPKGVWIALVVGVAVLVGLVAIAGRKKPAAAATAGPVLQPADAYAANLPLTEFVMSEADNLSGGKMIYLDGHLQNTGSQTVMGATVQVVFQNDEGLAPQIDSVPVTLIRMKSPYVDSVPINTNPIKPGDERDFRLTFETVPDNWNTQMPEVRLVHTDLK
jgi:hypothetical protein